MTHEHENDVFVGSDGSRELREPRVVEGSESLADAFSGGICVHEGANFEVSQGGHHSGSLKFQPDSTGRIVGEHSGSLHVPHNCEVQIIGRQSGAVHVGAGGVLKVEPSGRLAGSLHVAGLIENRGVRAGRVHLNGGEVLDVDGGTMKQPTTDADGTRVYRL